MFASKCLWVFVSFDFLFTSSVAAPVMIPGGINIPGIDRFPTIVYGPRPFFNSLGDFISGSDFFPIEINVPDTISNIIGNIQSITGGIQGGLSNFASNVVQRFPFLQNIQLPSRPLVLLFPTRPDRNSQKVNSAFYPFDPTLDNFPNYP